MDGIGRHYLVERFMPSVGEVGVSAAVARLEPAPDGTVEHVVTVLLEEEETCLSLFRATDALGVASANARAGFPFHRIVEVRMIPANSDGAAEPPTTSPITHPRP